MGFLSKKEKAPKFRKVVPKLPKGVEIVDDLPAAEPEEEVEEEPGEEEEIVESEENKSGDKVLQVPIFLTQQDVNRMTYENNLMLREIVELAKS